MLPMTGWSYGSQSFESVSSTRNASPYGEFSMRRRRSSFTTSRSRWKFSSFTWSFAIRSRCVHSARFSRFAGRISK